LSEKTGTHYERSATGLVRDISVLDAFFASFSFVVIPLALITYTTGPYLFPGSNLLAATLLTTLLSLPIAMMFTLFAWAMPRSGGDYVLNTRVLHPLIGFAANFSFMFWFIFFAGFEANWVTTLAISPSLLIIGTVTSNSGLVSLANTIVQPQYVLAIGFVLIVIFTLVLLSGVRTTFFLTKVLFLASLAGIGIALVLLAANTNASFIASFSRFASYSNITMTAHSFGYSPSGSNPLVATFGIMPYIYLTTGFAFITTYYGGEVRSVKKSMIYSQLLVALAAGLILSALAYFMVRDFGYDFLGSISYLQGTGNSLYPFGSLPPYFNLFISLLTSNPLVLWLLAITYVCALLAGFLPSLMAVSRSVFAWSFDSITPRMFAKVSDRFHVPAYTILVMSGVWAVTLVIYTNFSSSFLSLSSGATVGENITLIIVCIGAIVFPFRKKDLYSSSPANMKFAGIPLISLMGVISLGFIVMLQYFLLSNPLYGANNLPTWITIISLVILAVVIYEISYYYHKKRNLDITLAFKEIPPE
jgi:APA family basic amino acid/polyamine antiporter